MAEHGKAPRNMGRQEFAQWLVSSLEREGWSVSVKRTVEDWLYENTGRTVIARPA